MNPQTKVTRINIAPTIPEATAFVTIFEAGLQQTIILNLGDLHDLASLGKYINRMRGV